MSTLKGYRRENGSWGIRNHLLVIPTSVCASETASPFLISAIASLWNFGMSSLTVISLPSTETRSPARIALTQVTRLSRSDACT